MNLFERFAATKEDGFREEFVKPLLIRLGYYGISNTHGSQEFGKDYVFSELDPLWQFRHLVVQAKHLKTIHQGAAVDDLVSQIEQCFYVTYTVPFAPTENRHVSAVYVFNSGEITDNAETQIRTRLKKEYAANVRCFGGHHLEILATATAQRHDRNIRERLQALVHQIAFNVRLWKSLCEGIKLTGPGAVDMRRPLLHGIEEFLSYPVLPDKVSYADVADVWQYATVIDSITSWCFRREIPLNAATYKTQCELLHDVCKRATIASETLLAGVNRALVELAEPTI